MNVRISALGIGLALAACGGVTTGDVEDAARALNVDASSAQLRLAVGQTIEGTYTSVATDQFGTVTTSGEFVETPSSKTTQEVQYLRKSKIVGTTYVEPADKNGYVVEVVERQNVGRNGIGSVTVDDHLSGLDERSNHVLFDLDGWARQIGEGDPAGDQDLNPGSALYPLAPKNNGVYANDMGQIFVADGSEAVADVKAVTLSQDFTPDRYKLDEFFSVCFTQFAGSVSGSSNVTVKPECLGNQIQPNGEARFVLEQSTKMWVGKQLLLKRLTKKHLIRLSTLVCTTGGSVVHRDFNTGLTDCTGSISLGNNGNSIEQTTETTWEVTALGKDADKTALPELPADQTAE